VQEEKKEVKRKKDEKKRLKKREWRCGYNKMYYSGKKQEQEKINGLTEEEKTDYMLEKQKK
jgi:hypothetical protein